MVHYRILLDYMKGASFESRLNQKIVENALELNPNISHSVCCYLNA